MSNSTPIDLNQETFKSSNKHVPERTLGTTMLPLARIKRVIKEDKDVSLINAEATFCIAYATELFMEYLVTEAFAKAKKDKRKTVYYKDLASTVKESDQLEFLEDVIPTTMTLKDAMAKRKENLVNDSSSSTPPAKKQKINKSDKKSTKTKNRSAASTANTTAVSKSKSKQTSILDNGEAHEDKSKQIAEEDDHDDEYEEEEDDNDSEGDLARENQKLSKTETMAEDENDTMMEESPKQD